MAENRYRERVLGESVARFHLHFGEREDENVNGEVWSQGRKKGRVPRYKGAPLQVLIKILLLNVLITMYVSFSKRG